MTDVGVIMGSDSDFAVMGAAVEALEEFEVEYEVRVVSAHRTPLGSFVCRYLLNLNLN